MLDAEAVGTRLIRLILAGALAASLPGACGGDTDDSDRRQALEDYVAKVEPIRLGINELLDGADPILGAYADGEIDAKQAARRMGRLERGVAGYAVRIAAVEPVPGEIRAAHDAFAHTFVLQDTYLSTLVAAIPSRAFDELPHFQDQQRAAIIAWRTRLRVLADRYGVELPADIQIAGRGEISPEPEGE
jgi:hypothetical protein